MSQENGSLVGEDIEKRLVSLAYPRNLEEFRQFYDQGYQVATTAEQRVAWGLEPFESLSVLSHEQALRVLFAEPGDPILDELDEECYADENWELGEHNTPDAERIAAMAAERERRLDTVVTVRDPRRPAAAGSGGGGEDGPREVAAAPA